MRELGTATGTGGLSLPGLNNILIVMLFCALPCACGHDTITDYYDDGKVKAIHEVKDGVFNGLFKEYFESGGLKREGRYKNGQLDGTIKTYYETGETRDLLEYRTGKLNGVSKGYYKSGYPYYETEFINGLRVGWTNNYFDDPVKKVKEHRLFNDSGWEIYLKTFDQHGNVILNQVVPYLECKSDTINYDESIDISVNLGLKIPKTIVYFGLPSETLGLVDTLAVDTIGADKKVARFIVPVKKTGRIRVGFVFSSTSHTADSSNLNNVAPSRWVLIGNPRDKSS